MAGSFLKMFSNITRRGSIQPKKAKQYVKTHLPKIINKGRSIFHQDKDRYNDKNKNNIKHFQPEKDNIIGRIKEPANDKLEPKNIHSDFETIDPTMISLELVSEKENRDKWKKKKKRKKKKKVRIKTEQKEEEDLIEVVIVKVEVCKNCCYMRKMTMLITLRHCCASLDHKGKLIGLHCEVRPKLS